MPGVPAGRGKAMTGASLAPSADGAEPLVACDDVSVRLGGKPVLEHVSLAVAPGEIVTLIGPNGSGKTTLVRTILGLQAPQGGRIRRAAGLRFGYVPQRLTIDPILPLTVRRFLRLGGRHDESDVRRAVEEVGGSDLMARQIEELSGGELQRMALARALLRQPDLLVLDEPLQGVDFTGQLALFNLIHRVRRERGCGVLMVSHDLHLVMKGTDRVFCLNRHICCSGQPETVSRHPEYLALFGPRAEESLAVYAHDHDHDHALSGEVVNLPEAKPEPERKPRGPAGRSD
ncbi:MAG: zinc ABC transporter ATP-binding protein ZnuC [Kiloniellales bacterium]|nr:zinc ABC transporter ATP-binding protein ZnuC [Kiloniellales bacterium]